MTTAASDLTDRYVWAAGRIAKESERAEFERELRASIADLVDARLEQGDDEATAERAVLTALGDPDGYASRLLGRPDRLLGPRFYFVWRRLMIMLLSIVWPLATAGVLVGQLLDEPAWGSAIGGTVAAAITIGVHLCFWTTGVFVLLERTGAGRERDGADSLAWTLDRLPSTATSQRTPGAVVGAIFGAAVLLVLAGAIVWVQVYGAYRVDGEWIPLFAAAANFTWVPLLAVVFAAQAALTVVTALCGGWEWSSAIVNAVLQAGGFVAAVGLGVTDTLLNPDLVAAIGIEDAAQVITVVASAAFAIGAVFSAVGPFRDAARRASIRRGARD